MTRLLGQEAGAALEFCCHGSLTCKMGLPVHPLLVCDALVTQLLFLSGDLFRCPKGTQDSGSVIY